MRVLLLPLFLAFPAAAQQHGGTLQVHHRDSPGSLSIHEETTNSAIVPVMRVFNNLVRNSMGTIVSELCVFVVVECGLHARSPNSGAANPSNRDPVVHRPKNSTCLFA